MRDIEAVLWASIEDYAALYEAAWELNTLHPELGLNSSTRRAKWVIDSLVTHGFVDLYWCREPYGDVWLIADSQVSVSLALGRNWTPVPYGDIGIRISATEKGEALYHQLYTANRGQLLNDDSLISEIEGRTYFVDRQ